MRAINQLLYGNYRNKKFTDIWPSVEGFLKDYEDNGIQKTISETSATTLFYLLYARYGNSTIASNDINQFKYKVFTNIFMYGPTWEKRLQIQEDIRNLDLNEIMKGGKAVYNSALNPNQPVAADNGNIEGTNTLQELTYINQQNTTNYVKSKPEAYAVLWELLKTDVSAYFLDTFKKLFLTVVSPELPLWYLETEMEDGEDGMD